MNIKDLIVISLILSIIFWAIFHQMASKYINSNEILKKKIFGIDIYKNKSMDISNIELVITAVIMINVIPQFFMVIYNTYTCFQVNITKY